MRCHEEDFCESDYQRLFLWGDLQNGQKGLGLKMEWDNENFLMKILR